MKHSGNLNLSIFLKLRGSYGLVGSEALPNNLRYAYLSTWGGSGLGGYAWGGYNPTAVGGDWVNSKLA